MKCIHGICLFTFFQRALALSLPTTTSDLPEHLTDQFRCPEENRTSLSHRLGCHILSSGDLFFGGVDPSADLSVMLPRVEDKLFDNAGRAAIIRAGCFSISSLNEQISTKSSSFANNEGFESAVNSEATIDMKASASYMASSISGSYANAQDSLQKVNNHFAYAKSHVRSEIKVAQITRGCTGSTLLKYAKPEAKELWKQIKNMYENPSEPRDPYLLDKFNNMFRVLYPSEWLIGGYHNYELVTTITEDSSFNSSTMEEAVAAAANVEFASIGVEASMKKALHESLQAQNSSMKTKTDSFSTGVWPCMQGPDLLKEFQNMSDAAEIRIKCLKEFEKEFESWAPYKVVGYRAAIDIVKADPGNVNFTHLENELGSALHESIVKCRPLRFRGYRLYMNTSDYGVETLSECDPVCRFAPGGDVNLILERKGGLWGQYQFLVHEVSSKNYSGKPSRVLAPNTHRGPDMMGEDIYLTKASFTKYFNYNETANAFMWSAPTNEPFVPFAFPQAIPYPDISMSFPKPVVRKYFLTEDAAFTGLNMTHRSTYDMKTSLEAVKGFRAPLKGEFAELCNPL